ncbi:unnamed protein product [Lampetra fluviatilis]
MKDAPPTVFAQRTKLTASVEGHDDEDDTHNQAPTLVSHEASSLIDLFLLIPRADTTMAFSVDLCEDIPTDALVGKPKVKE